MSTMNLVPGADIELHLTPQEARLVQAFRGTDFEDMTFILKYVENMAWKRCGERSISVNSKPQKFMLLQGGRGAT